MQAMPPETRVPELGLSSGPILSRNETIPPVARETDSTSECDPISQSPSDSHGFRLAEAHAEAALPLTCSFMC